MDKPRNELIVTTGGLSPNHIQRRIITLRGVQVLLDRDLAELYGVPVKRLNEQVVRNIDRFPERFMFQLEPKEFTDLKSQIATSSWGTMRYDGQVGFTKMDAGEIDHIKRLAFAADPKTRGLV